MTSTVTLVGNLTRDPELRYTPNGAPVVTFGVAVNRRWKGKDDQWQENVSFFNVTAWNDLASNVATSLQKGARVLVTGRLEQRSWQTQDGEKRSTVEVQADEVGPSLRWATAEVSKTERREQSAASGGGDPWGGGQQPAAAYSPAEEPFHADAFWLWDH